MINSYVAMLNLWLSRKGGLESRWFGVGKIIDLEKITKGRFLTVYYVSRPSVMYKNTRSHEQKLKP